MQKPIDVVAYKYIENDLKEQICNGLIAPGERLPSMVDLCQKYNTSSTTIKKSLDNLKQSGYIYAKKRIGYFVSNIESDNFKIKFNLQDNLKDTITEIKIEDVKMCINKQHGSENNTNILVINRIFYNEVLPVAFEVMEIALNADIDIAKIDTVNWIKRLESVLYSQNIKKEIEVLLVQDQTINKKLMEPENTLLFYFAKTFKTNENQFIARTIIYIPNDVCKMSGTGIQIIAANNG